MTTSNARLSDLLVNLLETGNKVLGTQFTPPSNKPFIKYLPQVDYQSFIRWHAECANLVKILGNSGDHWKQNFSEQKNTLHNVKKMIGTIEAIQGALNQGLLLKIEELVRADTFGSLLDQADYLLAENYFLASGVLCRAVLEEHLRAWCNSAGCLPSKVKPTLGDYNMSLKADKHITTTTWKHFDSLIAIGNEAAHNLPQLTKDNVTRMVREVREVLYKYPIQ